MGRGKAIYSYPISYNARLRPKLPPYFPWRASAHPFGYAQERLNPQRDKG